MPRRRSCRAAYDVFDKIGCVVFRGVYYGYDDLESLSEDDRAVVASRLEVHERDNLIEAEKMMADFKRCPQRYSGQLGRYLAELCLHVCPEQAAVVTQTFRDVRDANIKQKARLQEQYDDTWEIVNSIVSYLPCIPMGFPRLPPELMRLILTEAQRGGRPEHFAAVSRYFKDMYLDHPDLLKTWSRWDYLVPLWTSDEKLDIYKWTIHDICYLGDRRYRILTRSCDDGVYRIVFHSCGKDAKSKTINMPTCNSIVSDKDAVYYATKTEIRKLSYDMSSTLLFQNPTHNITTLHLCRGVIYYENEKRLYRLEHERGVLIGPFIGEVVISETMVVLKIVHGLKWVIIDVATNTVLNTMDATRYGGGAVVAYCGATNNLVLFSLYRRYGMYGLSEEIIVEYNRDDDTMMVRTTFNECIRSIVSNGKDTIVVTRYDSYAEWNSNAHKFYPWVPFKTSSTSFWNHVYCDERKGIHVWSARCVGANTFHLTVW